MFHPRCGRCVSLSNGNKTATRTNPSQEFNRGLVFSFEPIKDNEVFEVKIDKKLNTWSGSIEIGVTVCNPDIIDIPITATDLKGGTWIMLGQGVFRDGQSLHEVYGCDLDKLVEGDRVGVMRNSKGELLFFVNGECQGVASRNLPPMVYAVADMYGKCAQITLTSPSTPDSNPLDDDSAEEVSSARDSNLVEIPSTPIVHVVAGVTEPSRDNQPSECLRAVASAPAARPPLAPTASEEASLTEATCSGSALTNHVANISIANSLISAHDSNLLQQEESSDPDESLLGGTEAGGELSPPSFDVYHSVCADSNTNVNTNEDPLNDAHNIHHTFSGRGEASSTTPPPPPPPPQQQQHRRQNDADNMAASERLRFHERAGILVRLSGGGRTAERKRPLDEFNNGVVMSNRALRINELFEIRIDRLVDKWSGSIEVGITTHNPNILEFPATMTSMRSGTIMMSGTAILTNGKGTLREYGNFNLDELKEGDRIGMMIKEGRNLHYFINGLEQGIAASSVPSPVWAVVDLYGMTVKVTIMDGDEIEEQNLMMRRNGPMSNGVQSLPAEIDSTNDDGNTDALLFHTTCGTYAKVINRGRTAHRPNAADDFNNGVVLTHRPLRPNEMFEVQLDKLVDKWAGSLEIGVTTHSPAELEFPSTMTNIRSGTWLMTSNGVTHNGTTIIETYGLNLDRLKVGERIGVCRKDDGSLHFYVDGVDRGVAATHVPERVYGVVDLYGQAAQVTISNSSDRVRPTDIAISSASSSTIYSDLRFHHLHGRNARIIRGGLVAQRPNANGEFNDAIVMSNRQLHDGEMFEVMIEKMVDRWSGSLEAGVTAIAPEQIDFPSTMTDIDYETWMLSGSSVMRNGVTIMNNYPCDLDSLGVGTRIGMMRHSDGTLHYYVNGEDQGAACGNLKSGLWAVIDLYGQCAQVSIVHNPVRLDQSLLSVSQYLDISRLSLPTGGQPSLGTEVMHRWSKCCGANIVLSNNQTLATRVRHFNHGLVFSSHSLEPDELFEIRLEKLNRSFSGSFRLGLTSLPISDSYPSGSVPSSLSAIETADTWWIEGSNVRRNVSAVLRLNYCPDLSRLQVGDKVGVKRTVDGVLRLLINGEDFGPAASNISKQRVFAVVELFGSIESVSITSVSRLSTPVLDAASAPIAVSQDSLELGPVSGRNKDATEAREAFKANDNPPASEAIALPIVSLEFVETNEAIETSPDAAPSRPMEMQFHENRGRNIELSPDRCAASRIESYNQGIVLSSKPLPRGTLFQVRLGALQSRWSSSLMMGVTMQSPDKLVLPNSAFDLKKNTWIICGDSVFFNGVKIKGRYGPNLDSLTGGSGGHLVGILVDSESRLHLYVNGVDQGVAAKEIPPKPFCIIDLYGQCQEVVIMNNLCQETNSSTVYEEETHSHKKTVKNHHQLNASIHHSHNLHHHLNLQQQQQQHNTHQSHLLTNNQQPNAGTTHRNLNREEQANNEVNTHRRQKNNNHQGEHISHTAALKDRDKDVSPSGPENTLIKNCEYQNLCSRFKASLALPDAYFSADGNVCYCETCHKIRGEQRFHTKGNPPKQYAQPVGWCRFSLVTAVGENNESWHMAYHGIRGGAIRRMLDKGELLFAGELGVNTRLPNHKSKDDVGDGSVLYFSPSIAYSSVDDFAPPATFSDPETKRQFLVKMVLQVAVEPGSYKVGGPSFPFDPSSDVSPHGVPDILLNNENIEWVTKERGATQLLAFLIRIETNCEKEKGML